MSFRRRATAQLRGRFEQSICRPVARVFDEGAYGGWGRGLQVIAKISRSMFLKVGVFLQINSLGREATRDRYLVPVQPLCNLLHKVAWNTGRLHVVLAGSLGMVKFDGYGGCGVPSPAIPQGR